MKETPVIFAGWQDPMGPALSPFELWNLTEAIPGCPKGGTLSRSTLERLGYAVPPAPYQFGESAVSAGFLAVSADGPAGSPSLFSQRKP